MTSAYSVFFLCFDAFANCLVHGWFHLNRLCDYGQAGEWYEKAFQLAEAHKGAYYDAARAWALSGDIDAAFRNLDKVLALGWADIARLKEEKDFAILQGAVRWRGLMRRLDSKGNQRPS